MNNARLTIDQSSAPQQVADLLRDLLLNGEIPPGVKLREEALSTTIGVSRHTLRSGFKILEAEGLVEQRLHRGVMVPDLSDTRIADVFKARKALEFAGIHAIETEGSGEGPRVTHALAAAVDRMRSAEDDSALAAADLDFHSAVVAAIGSKIIDETYRNIQAQLRLTRAWALRSRENKDLMAKAHGEVVTLLREHRHSDAVESLMAINTFGGERLLAAIAESKQVPLERPSVWPLNEPIADRKKTG